jgi:hypothetical protein
MQFENAIDMGYSALFASVFLELILPHQEIADCYFCLNRRDLIVGGALLAMWLTYKK